MANLRDLPIEPSVRDWLRDEKIQTSEDLWRAIGSRFSPGLARVTRKLRVSPGRLLHVLGAAAAAEGTWRLSRGEALGALALFALLALTGLRGAEALGVSPFPVPGLTAETDQTVIVPRQGLPAFHVLTAGDLRLAPRPRTAGGLARKGTAVGRYLLRPMPAGAVVLDSDLGAARLPAAALAGRWIVTLHIDPATLGPQTAAGTAAVLVLSPKNGSARPMVATEALVLSIDKGPAVATLAIPPERRADVAAALASSEVFLTRFNIPLSR